jgi:hypothetical protein
MKHERRCSLCVMSESYPGLAFNEDGVCAICSDARQGVSVDWTERKRELERRIASIRKEATKYHVIVPWSGGKDSTYVLYVMKKVYGLDVLALNFDNGFKSDVACRNLDRISRALGVDLTVLRPDWTLMRDLYKHYLKEKGELCSVCNMVGYILIFSFTLKETESLGYFPMVVGGWSGRHENVRSIFTFDYKEFRSIVERDESLFERFVSNGMVNEEVCKILETIGDPRVGSEHIGEDLGSKFFQLPDFLEWDVTEIKRALLEDLDWLSSSSPIAAHEDCDWHDSMKYLMYRKYGIDNDAIATSAMIRAGKLTRAEGLEILRVKDTAGQPEDMQDLLGALGCSVKDVNWDSRWYTGENISKSL